MITIKQIVLSEIVKKLRVFYEYSGGVFEYPKTKSSINILLPVEKNTPELYKFEIMKLINKKFEGTDTQVLVTGMQEII